MNEGNRGVSGLTSWTDISDVGDVPFHVIKPLLSMLPPEDLYRIEQCSSSESWDTNLMWKDLVHQVFPSAKFAAESVSSWKESFLTMRRLRDAKLKATKEKALILSRKREMKKGKTILVGAVASKSQKRAPLSAQHRSSAPFSSIAGRNPTHLRVLTPYRALGRDMSALHQGQPIHGLLQAQAGLANVTPQQ